MSSSPAFIHATHPSLSASLLPCTDSASTLPGTTKPNHSNAHLKGTCTPPQDELDETEIDSVASSRPSNLNTPVIDTDYSLDFSQLHISANCNPVSSSTPG